MDRSTTKIPTIALFFAFPGVLLFSDYDEKKGLLLKEAELIERWRHGDQ